MEKIKVLIYGAGAIGVYFGGKLVAAGHDVTFVDRPERVEAIRQGLQIRSNFDQNFTFTPQAVDDPSSSGPQDLILVAVRAFHTYEIAMKLLPVLKPDSIIASLQNGLENERILSDLVGPNLVIGCVPRFSGSLEGPCTLVQHAPAQLIYGEMDHQPSARMEWLSHVFAHAGLNHKISHNITLEIWKNFIWNNSFNIISAVTRTSMAQILACNVMAPTLEQMMREVKQVAQAEGVDIPIEVIEELKSEAASLGNVKGRMLRDLESGQMPELEPLSGILLKKAEQQGITLPVNQTLFNLMRLVMTNYNLPDELG